MFGKLFGGIWPVIVDKKFNHVIISIFSLFSKIPVLVNPLSLYSMPIITVKAPLHVLFTYYFWLIIDPLTEFPHVL